MYIHTFRFLLTAIAVTIFTTEVRSTDDVIDPTEAAVSCSQGTMGNDSAYMCERLDENGNVRQFGFRFIGNDGEFYCGEFGQGSAHGDGYAIIAVDDENYVQYCGEFSEGKRNGNGAAYFFDGNSVRLGSYLDGQAEGRFVLLWPKTNEMAMTWYEHGSCQSAVTYNNKGTEVRRDPHRC